MADDKSLKSLTAAVASGAEATGAEWGPVKTKSRRSGTYLYAGDFLDYEPIKHKRMRTDVAREAPSRHPGRRINPWFGREEVRLDIDGDYPQMAISGTGWNSFALLSHWVALLAQTGPDSYEGQVFYAQPVQDDSFYCHVTVLVGNNQFSGDQTLDLVFTTLEPDPYTRSYIFQSPRFHKVEFEYDYVTGSVPVTAIDAYAHPNRPPTLTQEILGIETVFERAGFDVTMSGGESEVGLGESGDGLWVEKELHDAMQVHWSHHADKPQWALWVLFAGHHADPAVGGIMFDYTNFDTYPNPYQRQGAAIFLDSFIGTAPDFDPNQLAWVERMRFSVACHELGHCFNLGHSWKKGDTHTKFWIPNQGPPDTEHTLSFMNTPSQYPGGEGPFFHNFGFRFSDSELLFLRHAPSRYVEPGNETFMNNFAFEQAAAASPSDFELRLSTAVPNGRFAYLTPPVIEVALTNRSSRPQIVSSSQLADLGGLVLMIGSQDRPMRQWQPYLRHCRKDDDLVLQPGEALYDSIMIGAGRTGWHMTLPGRYGIQAVLTVGDQLVFSNPLTVTVEAPASRAEERLAVDFFTPEVGRVLAVNGSRGGAGVNAILARALELKDNPVSDLAAMALATPLSFDFKLFEFGSAEDAARGAGKRFATYKSDPVAVRKLLAPALADGAERLIDAMGHARFLREAPLLAGIFDKKIPRGLAAFEHFRNAGVNPGAAVLPVGREFAAMLARKGASLAR